MWVLEVQVGDTVCYLEDFDPDGLGGVGNIILTTIPRQAKKFKTPGAAYRFVLRPSKVKPYKENGHPNRPGATLAFKGVLV